MEYIFCIGIPFLLIAAGLWIQGTQSWPDYFNVTYIPFLNNWLGSFIFTVALLLLPILGCSVGYLVLVGVTSIFETSEEGWIALEKSPQDIEILLEAEFYTVYVQTKDGRLLSCHYESPYDKDCWVEIFHIPEFYEFNKCPEWRGGNFAKPLSSISVVDRIDVDACVSFAGIDDRYTSSFILSDKGRVYMYSVGDPYFFSAPNSGGMVCGFSAAGLIMGLIAVIGLIATNNRQNILKRTPS